MLKGTPDEGFAGVSGGVRSHLSNRSIAFLRGSVGYRWDLEQSGLEYEVLGGVRWVF